MEIDFQPLEKLMRRKRVDALLFFSRENIRYLCGFTGSDGVLVVAGKERIFLSDSRYEEQAREETWGARFRKYRQKIAGLAELLKSLPVKRVGFESAAVNYESYQQLKGKIPRTALIPLNAELRALRARKRPDEMEKIKEAIRIASRAFLEAVPRLRPGAKERAVADTLDWRMKKRGGEGNAFPTIFASGERAALPHGGATQKRVVSGETVVVDFGVCFQGYNSDETQTIILGRPDREQRRVYETVLRAQEKAMNAIRPGVSVRRIDAAAREVIARAGYGKFFGHGTGHGVGLAVHEEPAISLKGRGVVEEGMVFTVEPGVYIPGWGGVRLEDMVVVTGQGYEKLTALSKKLEDNIK